MSNRKRTSSRDRIPAGGRGGPSGHGGRREHRPPTAAGERSGGVLRKWKWIGIVLALGPAATFYGLGRYFEFHSPGA
ncbi:MAG: hypothetical protein JW810_12385, partial [Sedimentisphaerales bacterium]|nr:hypothetical protein [Sedimentisphaerales bacterium]